jgi:hypothetical protein
MASFVRRRFWTWCAVHVLLAGALWVATGVRAVHAQGDSNRPHARPAETRTNLFAAFDLPRAADGMRVDLPGGWQLIGATVLRYGSERVPATVRSSEGATWIAAQRPLRGPHEVVLHVKTGAATGVYTWSVVPAMRQASQWRTREAERVEERIRVVPPPRLDPANRALAFREDEGPPVQLQPDAVPAMKAEAPFTVEFWMQTTGLDEIVASTWSGDEADAYPLEVVVDPSGRLRFYCGQPGRHQALVSPQPVADGQWHHVAVVHDAEDRVLRLALNGAVVDSLTSVQVPAGARAQTLALGGRIASATAPGPPPRVQFTGRVDEVRLWSQARSPQNLQRTMQRPSVRAPGLQAQLQFDDATRPAGVATWPRAAERVRSTLSLRTTVRNLRASTESGSVRLRWTADPADVRAFVVERSTDGRAFTELARLDPQEAERTPGSEAPSYQFTDPNAPPQVVFYRIRHVYPDGVERVSGTLKIGMGAEADPTTDTTATLVGNFPNPFSEATTIVYEVAKTQSIALSVWDLTGHRIARLVDDTRAPGRYEQPFSAADLPSGTYFIRLETEEGIQSHPMVLVK